MPKYPQEKAMTALEKVRQALPPRMSPQQVEMARAARRCIMKALDHSRAAAITLTTTGGSQPTVDLPPAALKLIGQLLGAMSEGRPITLMPAKREFSTVEAANFLHVSRPFVIKEIEKGRLPHRKVGTHRTVALVDLVTYGARDAQAPGGRARAHGRERARAGLDC
jgi:excisionase family DNA binding protein